MEFVDRQRLAGALDFERTQIAQLEIARDEWCRVFREIGAVCSQRQAARPAVPGLACALGGIVHAHAFRGTERSRTASVRRDFESHPAARDSSVPDVFWTSFESLKAISLPEGYMIVSDASDGPTTVAKEEPGQQPGPAAGLDAAPIATTRREPEDTSGTVVRSLKCCKKKMLMAGATLS